MASVRSPWLVKSTHCAHQTHLAMTSELQWVNTLATIFLLSTHLKNKQTNEQTPHITKLLPTSQRRNMVGGRPSSDSDVYIQPSCLIPFSMSISCALGYNHILHPFLVTWGQGYRTTSCTSQKCPVLCSPGFFYTVPKRVSLPCIPKGNEWFQSTCVIPYRLTFSLFTPFFCFLSFPFLLCACVCMWCMCLCM